MIRNLIGYSYQPSRVCRFIISQQNNRIQFKRTITLRVPRPNYPLITRFNFRTMSTGDGRDLFYDDIVKLSKDKNVVLIDVREPDEIKETGLLPGSIHIPLGEVPDALKALEETFKLKYGIDKPGQDKELVFSCRSGKRSRMALNQALEQGYNKSKHYAGGWLDWESKTKG